MSYILDALKKSDRERHRGGSPDLHVVHGMSPAGSPQWNLLKKTILLTTLTAGLVVLTVAAIYVIQDYSPQSSITDIATTSQPAPDKGLTEPVIVPAEPEEAISSPVYLTRKKIKLRLPVAGQPEPTAVDLPSLAADQTNELPLLKELPAEFVEQLPELNFAGHTYAEDPGRRMIIINGKILREGDMIDPTTRLVNITWEGMVLQTNSVRYRVKTQ